MLAWWELHLHEEKYCIRSLFPNHNNLTSTEVNDDALQGFMLGPFLFILSMLQKAYHTCSQTFNAHYYVLLNSDKTEDIVLDVKFLVTLWLTRSLLGWHCLEPSVVVIWCIINKTEAHNPITQHQHLFIYKKKKNAFLTYKNCYLTIHHHTGPKTNYVST